MYLQTVFCLFGSQIIISDTNFSIWRNRNGNHIKSAWSFMIYLNALSRLHCCNRVRNIFQKCYLSIVPPNLKFQLQNIVTKMLPSELDWFPTSIEAIKVSKDLSGSRWRFSEKRLALVTFTTLFL